MIEVCNITKRYGHLTAIDRVTFRVEKGEVLAFLGPNGAGKTTTMRILTSFIPATEGTAQVAGFDCAEQPEEVKKRIGYLPETPPVYQELTVAEYLGFVGKLRGLSGTSLTQALDRAGIPWTAFKYAENLGQFQVIREQAGTFADSIKLWSEA